MGLKSLIELIAGRRSKKHSTPEAHGIRLERHEALSPKTNKSLQQRFDLHRRTSTQRLGENLSNQLTRLLYIKSKLEHSTADISDNYAFNMQIQEILHELQDSVSEVELLAVLDEYVTSLECELKQITKMVSSVRKQNISLQNDVVLKHGEWLGATMRHAELEMQLCAWQFALALDDANYFAMVPTDDRSEWHHLYWDAPACGNPSNISALPWVYIPENKIRLMYQVRDELHVRHYSKAVELSLNVFESQRIYQPSQRHRYPSACTIDLPKAIEYFADLTVRCHLGHSPNEATICARYAIKLTQALSSFKQGHHRFETDHDSLRMQLYSNLTSPLIRETEWATLLECFRKLVQVYWRMDLVEDAVTLWLAISDARKSSVWNDTKPESWRGYSQVACLLTAGLCLFSGQLSLISLNQVWPVNQSSLFLLELAVQWAEGALSIGAKDSRSKRFRSKQSTFWEDDLPNSKFLLWGLMIECLCRQCINIGAVYDVLLLAIRMLGILFLVPTVRVNGTPHTPQIFLRAIEAEISLQNMPCSGVDVINQNHSSAPAPVDVQVFVDETTSVHLAKCVESVLLETVLALRGEQWTTAASILEQWIQACQQHTENLEAKRKKLRQTNQSMPDRFQPICSSQQNALSSLKRKTLNIPFLHFISEASTNECYLLHQHELAMLSLVSVSKHRDYEPEDSCCCFSSSPTDPRSKQFSTVYKQLIPQFLDTLCRAMSVKNRFPSSLTLDHFLLQSNRRIYLWWRATSTKTNPTQTLYIPSPMLTRRDLTMMWEEALMNIRKEFASILKLKAPSPLSPAVATKSLRGQSTPRLLPVVESIVQDPINYPFLFSQEACMTNATESINLPNQLGSQGDVNDLALVKLDRSKDRLYTPKTSSEMHSRIGCWSRLRRELSRAQKR